MRVLTILYCLCLGLSHSANAQSYQIAVKQIQHGKDGWTYTNQCHFPPALCHVFMGITPENQDAPENMELDVGITQRKNSLYLQFKSGWNYLFVSPSHNYYEWPLNDKEHRKTISLFMPPETDYNDPINELHNRPVIRPPLKKIADIEITVKQPAH